MRLLRKARENLFIVFIAAAYVVVFAVKPALGLASVRGSVYFIKEMVMIMPVIFVLTALLDLWVPKEKIIRYLGREAGTRGAVFSLILGSISAGPIYAAFPLCAMLHRKGASVRNLVIILSAWAVIKVPMLLNEMKFLGPRFMAVRWVLTVAAILLFSRAEAAFVRDGDLPRPDGPPSGATVDRSACMGCGLCAKNFPELFEMREKKAALKAPAGEADPERLRLAADACPVGAIRPAGDAEQA